MKRLKLLTALSIGIMASASGVLQVEAATYNFFVDFSTKEVADYTEFRQTFNENTNNLNLKVEYSFIGKYKFDSCPTAFTTNVEWELYARANGTGSFTFIGSQSLPNFTCTTTFTSYFAKISINLDSTFLDLIVDDDTNFIQFNSTTIYFHSAASNGRTLTLAGYRTFFDLFYQFNTTYLFNYFLSDQAYVLRVSSGSWSFTGTQSNELKYVYTTAGNDSYYIFNSPSADIGTTRKKYAINYNEEFFRGNSVGAGFDISVTGSDSVVFTASGSSSNSHRVNYHYLNLSNLAQEIVDAPIFEFEEEDCGSFLALNVGCFINNAFAYITNDAPIVSDAFTLLNAGIEMAAQTFGIIGEFADDNVFGVLILAGFGFIAVKWFLKND
jgi:hypothetical protein